MTVKRIPCPRGVDKETGRAILHEVQEQGVTRGDTVVLDLTQTEAMDTFGGAWLVAICDYVRARKGEIRWEGQRGDVANFINLIEPGLATTPAKKHRRFSLTRLLDDIVEIGGEFRDFSNLVVDSVYWTFVGPFEGRGFRWGLFVDELHEMGVRAVWINCVMNFMLGLVVAMLSAAQLRLVGLDIYVADLIVIAFARELGALTTATVVAARTGAAITAELATMKVQEEIDALRGMGLNVAQFLIAPKVLALLVCMPCLVALGMLAGVLGGACWGVFALGFDIGPWYQETMHAVLLKDFFQGFAKCLCYALTIVLIGCHNGLRVEGGSRGVGLATTRAVVMDTFFIVLIDMVFAVIFYYVL